MATLPLQTRSATFSFASGKVVLCHMTPGIVQSADDARENLSTFDRLSAGRPLGLLLDLSEGAPLPPDVRRLYAAAPTGPYAGMALVLERSPLGRMIGNVFLRLSRPPIPARLFTSRTEARTWLETLQKED